MIVGDMDSVSDRALGSGAEILIHAYENGSAPGAERVRALGLDHHVVPAPATSEDLALLLAYEKGAELIVAVGTHFNLVEFLERNREGMSSTFMARLRVGEILVDAKGDVGRRYDAKTTPHMYVIDAKGMLVYRGAIDNAPNGKPEDGEMLVNYVDAALADIKSGKPVAKADTKSYGCTVKY